MNSDRKAELDLAKKLWKASKGRVDTPVQIYEGNLSPEEMIAMDSLLRKEFVRKLKNGVHHQMTSKIKEFIDNGGYTNEELTAIKDEKRKDWTLYIAVLALLVSIISLLKSYGVL